MALTEFQRSVCHLIADNRIRQGESYVARGAALNTLIGAPRRSRDIDLFHDTDESLAATWEADRKLLGGAGYTMEVIRERPTFVEASAAKGGESVLLQWVRDSAYRFFPLLPHEDFGLTMHPYDLATNKVLASVGRLEVRDWIDLIQSHERVQPLGYLAWGACGKDPGFSPRAILEHARRSRYSAGEVANLSFEGPAPDPAALSKSWHRMLDEAAEIIDALPHEEAGKCVVNAQGALFDGSAKTIREALRAGDLFFHAGSIRGALPRIVQGDQGRR